MSAPTDPVGKWDGALFTRFRAAVGQVRRALAERLLRQNEPLIKTLVAQILGTAPGVRGAKTKYAKIRVKAELIDWDDAMSLGRWGFLEALERFDPAKGKIAFYARMRILWRLQEWEQRTHIVKPARDAPEELKPRGYVYLSDDTTEHILAEHIEHGEIPELADVTPALLADWSRTGDWPDSLEELRERLAPPKTYVLPQPTPVRTPLEQFLAERCVFGRGARVTEWQLWNAYRLECRASGRPELQRASLLADLASSRGIRPTRVRDEHGSPRRGLAGIRLAPVWEKTGRLQDARVSRPN